MILALLVSLTVTPPKTELGQAVFIEAKSKEKLPETLKVTVGQNNILLFPCPKNAEARCGLAGIPADLEAPTIEVKAKWTDGETKLEVPVKKKKYPVTVLKVDPSRVHPSEEEQKRIDEERKVINAAYETPIPLPLWTEPMVLPGKGPVTSGYGGKRMFNGELKSTHYGTDLRASVGSPIFAANDGKVVVARELFYAGNMVLLDHGAGLFSSYSHLSQLKVAVGDSVKRGDLVGLSGATGRVTGPHLHWGTRVNGLSVDPIQLKALISREWAPPKTNRAKKHS